ncbi:MAG: sulfatase family protein [Planctomycetota bacterium]|jgi:N-acetylgalactosamine-6-sulfatase
MRNQANILSIASVLLFASGTYLPADNTSATSNKPNFIFILADDLGWGDLGCYGHKLAKTPNLDRLAKQGTLFTQFYVCSGVCSPSRAAFMTGQFPAKLRIHGHIATPKMNADRGMPDYLDPNAATASRLLQRAGYKTAHFGKWHLGSTHQAPAPSEYGFDQHYSVNANGPGWDQKQPYFRANSTEYIMDKTIKFIETNRDKSFYVQAWLLLTHATLHPTEEQMKPYARFAPGSGVPYKGAKMIYYASVSAIDKEIGRLMDKLRELKMAKNTVIIFSSDNGPEDIHIRNASHSGIGSPGPFRGRKRSLYEGGVRVPFIVCWPASTPAGKVDNNSVICGADFLPTVCSLAGIKLPANLKLDGEDMSPALRGQPQPRTKPIMWEWRYTIIGYTFHKSPMLAIRDGNWKLLINPDRSRVELYHIPKDPTELNNLADRKPNLVKKLAHPLTDWAASLPPGPRHPAAGANKYPWPK